MNGNKADQNAMNEAWDQVGKVVNQATELYLKEVETYLDWAQSVRKEMLEQTIAASQQMSKIGETQYAFMAQMQQNLPLFGRLMKWPESVTTPSGVTEKRSGRAV